MHFRSLNFVGAVAIILSLVPGQAMAQSLNAEPAKPATQIWRVPRTVDGQPDFQGVWANNSATPLERPKVLEGRAFLTDEEVVALKKKAAELFDNGNSDAAFGDTVFESVLANVRGAKSGFKSTDGGTGRICCHVVSRRAPQGPAPSPNESDSADLPPGWVNTGSGPPASAGRAFRSVRAVGPGARPSRHDHGGSTGRI